MRILCNKQYEQEDKILSCLIDFKYSILVSLILRHVPHKATHVYSKNVFVWHWWGQRKEMIKDSSITYIPPIVLLPSSAPRARSIGIIEMALELSRHKGQIELKPLANHVVHNQRSSGWEGGTKNQA